MAKICQQFWVSGRVQGVYYRQSTKNKALELGLTGWVRNLPDGRVELLACGEESKLQGLQQWLWQGPPAAKVLEVLTEITPLEEHQGFAICR